MPRDDLRRFVTPTLRDPAAILAFEGWNDAGEAASGAARYVAEGVRGVPLAEVDPEEFFDFTVRRPEVSLGEGDLRHVSWPTFDLRYGSAGPERDLVVGVGPEPHFRWRRYVALLRGLLEETGVRRVALVGSFLADVLYSRPVRVMGFASDPELVTRLAIEPSGYEGPTGIVGVLASELREAGLEVVSLWVGLPHYINAAPNPRGSLALLHKLTQYLGFRVDEAPLAQSAAEFENRVNDMVAADPALTEYVRDLKRREFAQ